MLRLQVYDTTPGFTSNFSDNNHNKGKTEKNICYQLEPPVVEARLSHWVACITDSTNSNHFYSFFNNKINKKPHDATVTHGPPVIKATQE